MADDLLDRMRRNPAGDWTMADVERLCRQHGIDCRLHPAVVPISR